MHKTFRAPQRMPTYVKKIQRVSALLELMPGALAAYFNVSQRVSKIPKGPVTLQRVNQRMRSGQHVEIRP